jgi:5-methylcytosine-specific restriction protein A
MADRWTDDELRASLKAYLEMLGKHRRGEKFVKKQYFRNLAADYPRSEKSFERRSMNISHVLALKGRDWLPGLLPAPHVGVNVIERIEQMLSELEELPVSSSATFEARVRKARKRTGPNKPTGNPKPKAKSGSTNGYIRDPEVKGWVLGMSNGLCECCGGKAPFWSHDDVPFLEVHHVWQLCDGGPDVVDNAVAVCPNCHRALHFSRDKDLLKKALYEKVDRLVTGGLF